MRCGDVFRHILAHERCWHCVGSHKIHISDWPKIHTIISWRLLYARTWSYPDQLQTIVPVPHASPRQSISCYRSNEYYQSKRRFFSVLEISRGNIYSSTPGFQLRQTYPHSHISNWLHGNSWIHIKLRSPQKKYVKKEIEAQNLSRIGIKFHQSNEDDECQIVHEKDIIFNTQRFNQIMVDIVGISVKQELEIESSTTEQQKN